MNSRTDGIHRRGSAIAAILLTLAIMLTGCYSFTGASIPPHIHTIGIPLAEDNSGSGRSDVRQNLTDMLVQQFTNEGSLRVANRANSDALLEISINQGGLLDEAVSVKTGDAVTNKRVTLTVHAIYRDQKKQKDFWERNFSETQDYSINNGLAGLTKALHDAEDQASKDILIAVISNW